MLKRLQEKNSFYDVISWELDRQKQIEQLKKICYYPPTFLKKKGRSSRKRGADDPNQQVYSLYQSNLLSSQRELSQEEVSASPDQQQPEVQLVPEQPESLPEIV